MDTKDITERQFETLMLLRALKEFIKENNEFGDLDDAVVALMEGQSIDRDDFIKDICVLTENGYVCSDADEDNIAFDLLPEIEDITMKGVEILDNFVKQAVEKQTSDKKETTKTNEFALVKEVSFNFSLLGGMEFGFSLFKDADSLFKQFGAKIGKLFK